MSYATCMPGDVTPSDCGRPIRAWSPAAVCAVFALATALPAGAWLFEGRPTALPISTTVPGLARPVPGAAALVPPPATDHYGALLAPSFTLGFTPVPLAASAPLAAELQRPAEPVVALAEAPPPAAAGTVVAQVDAEADPEAEPVIALPATPPLPIAMPGVPVLTDDVPLPAPRPPELDAVPLRPPFRAPPRQMAQSRRASPGAAPADNRGFLEKLFGIGQQPSPSGPALAYAAPEEGLISRMTRGAGANTMPFGDRSTAVYDIAAHTVYMPDGSQLEAHSGLGDRLDNPRYVHERMRGATPPHVYDLRPREALFHGVQALRLNPVGGGGVFGRTGLLAHTFMLGPNGDSNGCVSFRNYRAFLQAYMNGEVKRLAVVASRS